MACLEETTVARLLDRSLSPAMSEGVVHHLDECEDCRLLVSELARHQPTGEGSAIGSSAHSAELSEFARGFAPVAGPAHPLDVSPDEPAVAPPSQLGRYRLTRVLGKGAMGTVYAAHDPELDRELAIKMLPLGPRVTAQGRARLLREAKALAKVAHPNVISIFDVGTVDEHVFIAMELVRSGTLREWLRQPRTIDAILGVMAEVGRGLAAAHAGGLVHRDVKPENILVDQVDARDRGRIGDFGLALVVDDEAARVEPGAPGEPTSRQETLTQTGTFVGTPAYMAPEQFARGVIDARSDQFSFCVTLYEAIYGERPFDGVSPTELAANVLAGKLRVPRPVKAVPSRIRAALRRGLATSPEGRFPSMEALIAALSPRRTRRRRSAIAAIGLVIAAVSATWAVTDHGKAVTAMCPEPRQQLAGIWDVSRRDALVRALAGAGPFGVDVGDRTAEVLDGYVRRWSTSWRDNCTATRERGEQSTAMFDLRLACLQHRLHAFDALVGTLATSDPAIAARAGALVGQLEPVSSCDDVTSLLRMAPPPAARGGIELVDAMIDQVGALRVRGRYAEARVVADQALAEASRIGYRPREARAQLALGRTQADVGQFADAEKSLQRASSEAIAGDDDLVAAEALIDLVDVVAYRLGRPAEAHHLADLARASLERIGDPPMIRLRLLNTMSRMWLLEGKHDDALRSLDEAIALAEHLPGGEGGELAAALSAKAIVQFERGRFEESRQLNTRELELRAAAEGVKHPLYANALEHRASLAFVANDFEHGVADLRAARKIEIEAFGPDTPQILGIENNLGVIAGELGDWTEELRASRVALALAERTNGPDHPDAAHARNNVGIGLRELGKLDEAERELARVLAVRLRVLGPDHQDVGNSLHHLGELRLAQRRTHDAIELFQRSRDVLVKALGATNPLVAYATSGLGRAQLAAGDAKTARATLAATLEALERSHVDPVLLSRTRLAHADASWQLGDKQIAIAEAARAIPDLAPLPASSNQPLRAAIATWRAHHVWSR